jgi:hypothetical protein
MRDGLVVDDRAHKPVALDSLPGGHR